MSTRTIRAVSLATGILAVITAAACAVGPVVDDRRDEPTPTAAGSRPADGSMTIEEFEDDVNGAVSIADSFWAARFEASNLRFTPVAQIVTYQREGEIACGGQPLPRNNAAYCSAGDFIAYDVRWAVAAFQQIGDAFLYYLLGHEYAHAIQARLGTDFRYGIERELQADCMAGALIGDSVRDGDLILDDGDLEELGQGLRAVGDDPGQPWFAPESHGTAEQRTDAFLDGYDGSLRACDL